MHGKYSLDALAVRDAAHGESFVDSPTLTANDYAGEYLDSFLVSFHNAGVHAHAIANRKRFGITFLLFLLNRIDDLIHKLLASARRCGRTLSFEGTGFATRNPNQLGTSKKHQLEQGTFRKSVKICGIYG
jgi:hypothetical protein